MQALTKRAVFEDESGDCPEQLVLEKIAVRFVVCGGDHVPVSVMSKVRQHCGDAVTAPRRQCVLDVVGQPHLHALVDDGCVWDDKHWIAVYLRRALRFRLDDGNLDLAHILRPVFQVRVILWCVSAGRLPAH